MKQVTTACCLAAALLMAFQAMPSYAQYDCAAQSEVPQAECEALVAFYNATGGDGWTTNTNWLAGDVSSWHGVAVSEGHVTQLVLTSNNLVGTLPPDIGNLTDLTNLSLGINQLSGTVPTEIGNLTNLTNLTLSKNELGGTLPAVISNLTSLVNLSLNDNQFTGPIPAEIGNLINVTFLTLSGNQVSGSLPPEIGNMSSLEELRLSLNNLDGPLPVEIGNLTNLTNLSLENNQFSGPIPDEIGNLTSLQYLTLRFNQLSGPLPAEIGNLTTLIGIFVDGNAQLMGSLPATLTNLTQLGFLYFSGTNLCEPTDTAFQMWLQGIQDVRSSNLTCTATPIEATDDLPSTYTLAQNYPNPFNPSTTIRYGVPASGPVRLAVYDLLGREVTVLVQGNQSAGWHEVAFDAGDLPAGVYLYRLTAGNNTYVRMLTLLK